MDMEYALLFMLHGWLERAPCLLRHTKFLNRMYLDDGTLNVRTLGRGYAWLDTGTMDSLYEAGEFVRTVQRAQGLPIAVVEEIAYENGVVSSSFQPG